MLQKSGAAAAGAAGMAPPDLKRQKIKPKKRHYTRHRELVPLLF